MEWSYSLKIILNYYSDDFVFRVLKDRRRQAIERDKIGNFLILFNNVTVNDVFSGNKPMFNIFFSKSQMNLKLRQVILKELSDLSNILSLEFSNAFSFGFFINSEKLNHSWNSLVRRKT